MTATAEAIGNAILALAGDRASGAKHDVSTNAPPTAGYIHGPGGILSYPGVDPLVYQTVVGFKPGVMNSIPAVGTRYMNPLFEIVTGIRAAAVGQSEPALPCDNAPVGGTLKAGMVTFRFGKYQRSTREIELNRLGQLNDRAEPMDLQLVGRSPGPDVFGAPASGEFPQGAVLRNEVDVVMQERATELNRKLQTQVWSGNPANNNAGGGYSEFAGLDLLLQQNWRDALTGNALPSLYPLLRNMSLARVDAAAGAQLINEITYMARYVRDLADRTGMDNVRWVWAMRPALFYELTKVWPCAYFTQLCRFGDSTTDVRQNTDLGDQIAMRDDMRNNRYLMIDGERWDVILDDAIVEFNNGTKNGVVSGCFSSDIYLLPLSVAGRATLYFEYFDFTNESLQSALGMGMVLARVLGNGAWLETIRQTNWCVQWQAKIEPRIVLRTPWLAGRIQNVQYCPLYQNREPFPNDPYFVNGDGGPRTGPSYFPPY